MKKLDEFPMINWDKFDTEKYFTKSYAGAHAINDKQVRVMPVVTARGCAFRCTFCHFVFWNDPYRYRSPENIICELKRNITDFDYVHMLRNFAIYKNFNCSNNMDYTNYKITSSSLHKENQYFRLQAVRILM